MNKGLMFVFFEDKKNAEKEKRRTLKRKTRKNVRKMCALRCHVL